MRSKPPYPLYKAMFSIKMSDGSVAQCHKLLVDATNEAGVPITSGLVWTEAGVPVTFGFSADRC